MKKITEKFLQLRASWRKMVVSIARLLCRVRDKLDVHFRLTTPPWR